MITIRALRRSTLPAAFLTLAMAASAPASVIETPRPQPRPQATTPTIKADRLVAGATDCSAKLSRGIPRRSARADSGTEVMRRVMNLGGAERDAVVTREVLSGNVPGFLRDLTPVRLQGRAQSGKTVEVTLCVTPEYLSVGSDRDFVRVPLGLPAAARIADNFGFMLPTTRMVDAIYQQARVRLAPSPMTPGSKMTTTSYLLTHNDTVDRMRAERRDGLDALTAGQKKDIVLSTRLRNAPGKVAIYGWHRTNGRPIQPLSTVHVARYADYSHGVRLISQTAFVDGRAVPLADIMADPKLAAIVSSEGPIQNPVGLQASLYR